MDDRSSLYVWQTGRRSRMCQHTQSGLGAANDSREAVLADFARLWNNRAVIRIVDGPPPRPKREGEPAPASAAIEGETDAVRFHRLVLRGFHPDLHGAKKRWSADEIIAVVNQAWEATRVRANA